LERYREIKKIEIEDKYLYMDSGTSDGTQIKYHKDDVWYKVDNIGGEGLSEYLASKVLLCSNLKAEEYVVYEPVIINGKTGCCSKNCLKDNESLISFYRLWAGTRGGDIAIYLSKMDYISKRYYRHSRNVFGLSFLIPYMAGTILAMFNFYYFALSKLVLGSLFVSLVISGIEGVLFDKKNKNKYARDYYNSEEYSKLKHELDKLEDDLKLKSQEFNNIILVIQKHNNQLDNTKTKYNDVKNRISGLVEDTFRVMYETQSLNFDEKHQEDKHEQSGPVKKLTPRNS